SELQATLKDQLNINVALLSVSSDSQKSLNLAMSNHNIFHVLGGYSTNSELSNLLGFGVDDTSPPAILLTTDYISSDDVTANSASTTSRSDCNIAALLGGVGACIEDVTLSKPTNAKRWLPLYRRLLTGGRVVDAMSEIENKNESHQRLFGDGFLSIKAKTDSSASTNMHLLPAGGERRALTVMFCDIAGSTAMAQSLEEEELSLVLRVYHEACQASIDKYGGHVQQYLGDGVLAYFGYPNSFEDNAARAVNAALELVAALKTMNDRIRSVIKSQASEDVLHVRVGIHSGLAVVDEIGRDSATERFALGIVPTTAARLQEAAERDSVLISQSTERLIRGQFESESKGGIALKGIVGKMQVHQVHQASAFTTRFEVQVDTGLTPFTGREKELARLSKTAEEVVEKSGQLTLITGEAGIGKSRLLREFSSRLPSGVRRVLVRCSPQHQTSPLYPIIKTFRTLLGLRVGDSDAVHLHKLERIAKAMGLEAQTAVPLLANLVGLELSSRYQQPEMPPDQLRKHLTETLAQWLVGLAKLKPMCLIVEDWHWIDASSTDVFAAVVRSMPSANLFVVITSRPGADYESLITEESQVLGLAPLSQDDASSMVHDLAGERGLSPILLNRLLEVSDGVPLFIEESTNMVMNDVGTSDGMEIVIPATLQDLLTTRLDQLGEVKELAQLAAILGQSFSEELLAAVASSETRMLKVQIAELTEKGILRKTSDQLGYTFRHALIRDAAYQSLLRPARQTIHLRAARALQNASSTQRSELIAHHLSETDETREATEYWQMAGRDAVARGATAEAISHFKRGLQILENLPRDTEVARIELSMQTGLAGRLVATQGYGAAEVEKAYKRSLSLARELKDQSTIMRAMLGLEGFFHVQARFKTAHRLADQCMDVARGLGDPARISTVHWTSGEVFFHQGDYVNARIHLSACINGFEREFHRATALQNPAVMSLCYFSWIEYLQGEFGSALSTVEQAVDLAESLDHPFSRGVAYSFLAGTYLWHGRMDEAISASQQAITHCRSHGFSMWEAFATVVSGRAKIGQGADDAAIAEIEKGIAAWSSVGAVVTLPYCQSMLAEALLLTKDTAGALQQIDTALEMVEGNGEGFFHAEILRIRGEILALQDDHLISSDRPAANFRNALAIAQVQNARGLELRALTSLVQNEQRLGQTPDLDRLARLLQSVDSQSQNADVVRAKSLLPS
ncbi:MAG: class 3 adenylate cyclase/tetratricopeptide (TPR) repeat protein, partial [Candidatus Azotimanducaceae bacterium]